MNGMIRFMIAGDLDYSEARPETFVQMTELNCLDLLKWLWLPAEDWGYVPAVELAARCRRRMWPLPRNFDPAREASEKRVGATRVVVLAREAGYLRARTEELLKLAERAGPEGQILFS